MVGREGDVGENVARLTVEILSLPSVVSPKQACERLKLLLAREDEFLANHPSTATEGHLSAYARATRLMSPAAARAFSLDDEPAEIQERYGRSQFGQGCLLARRLVEREVPFVEVSLG